MISFSHFKPFGDKEVCHSSPETPPTVHVAQIKIIASRARTRNAPQSSLSLDFLQRGAGAACVADFFLLSQVYVQLSAVKRHQAEKSFQ